NGLCTGARHMKIWSNCRSGVWTINNKAPSNRIICVHNLRLRVRSLANGNGDLWPAVEYGPAKGFGGRKRGRTQRQQLEDAQPSTPVTRDRSPVARPPLQPPKLESSGRLRKAPGRVRQADRFQRTFPPSSRGTSSAGDKGNVPDIPDGAVGGLHVHVLSTTRWRSLTDLLIQSQSSQTHSAAVVSNDDGAGPSTGANGPSAGATSTSIPEPLATAPIATAVAAEGHQLTESALLLILWRIVCTQLLTFSEQRQQGLRPGLQSLPRPLPFPGPFSLGEDPWRQQLWSGTPTGAADPWDFQSKSSFGALGGLGGSFSDMPTLTRRTFASPLSSETAGRPGDMVGGFRSAVGPAKPPAPLVGSSVARHRCLEAVEAAARRLAPGMSRGGLVVALQLLGCWAAAMSEGADTRGLGGGEVWRLAEPFLAAAAAAASTSQWVTADLVALVAALPPLHRFCPEAASISSGRDTSKKRTKARGKGDNVNGGRSSSSPQPVTHEALAAALSALAQRADMVVPSPSELTVCIAAAAACGYAPQPSWLALLRSELRNQLFLLTAPQGAVILDSLERLPPSPPQRGQEEGQKSAVEGGAKEAMLPESAAAEVNGKQGEVAMLWAELQGKAAALDLGGGVEALLELSQYVEVGLLLPTSATSRALLDSQHPQQLAAQPPPPTEEQEQEQEQLLATVGVGVGHGVASGTAGRRLSPVQQLTRVLLGQLAPQLADCSGEQLTAVLVAAARLYEYEHDSGNLAVGATAPVQAVAGPANVSGLDSKQQQQQQHVSSHLILEPVARSLLRRVRSGSLSLPQIGACVAALVTLLTAAATTSPTPAGERRPTATPAPAPAAAAALAALLLEVPEEVLRCTLGATPGRSDVSSGRRSRAAGQAAATVGALGPEGLAWLLPLETSLVAMEEHLTPRLPLLRQVLLQKAQQLRPEGDQLEGTARGATEPPSGGAQERRLATGARGLAARAMSGVMSNLKQLSVAQLLELAAASQHPQTSG
ncbi:hypothetical protein Vafri_2918, partial [Volvox africanus]